MTTTVKVEAHCDANTTEVQIVAFNEVTVIQDGETHEVHAYDDHEVTVREIAKVSEVKQANPLSEECPD